MKLDVMKQHPLQKNYHLQADQSSLSKNKVHTVLLHSELFKGAVKGQNPKMKERKIENAYEDQQLRQEPKIKSHMKVLPAEQIE